MEGRDAGDEAALQAIGTATPRHELVRAGGEKLGALDEIGTACRRKVAEDIAPATGAQDGSAQPALAVAKAFDGADIDIAALRGATRAFSQQFAGAGVGVGSALVAACRADDNRDRGTARLAAI